MPIVIYLLLSVVVTLSYMLHCERRKRHACEQALDDALTVCARSVELIEQYKMAKPVVLGAVYQCCEVGAHRVFSRN